MIKTRSLLTDGAWVAALQGLSAVGQLLGIRLLTDVVPPSVFGEVSLWIGVVALISAAMANPTMQALLRFYPEFHAKGEGLLVKSAVRSQLTKLGLFVVPVLAFGALITVLLGYASAPGLMILAAIVVVDVNRMSGLAYLNAVRAFKPAGIWSLIEAWGRPFLAYCLIKYLGIDVTWVLLAYLLVSFVAWVLMRRFIPKDPPLVSEVGQGSVLEDLGRRFWKYSIPLLPLGLIGWVSGMSDRYIIGLLLTPSDVGLYVAIYGLASRPMAMFGGVVETTIRPAYQQALVKSDHLLARDYLLKWSLLALLGSGAALIVSIYGHSFLAGLLLGSEYRAVSGLLPWIVGGYGLLILSHVANRVCYANEATHRVFLIETIGTVLSVVVGFVCIYKYGLFGAAISVPIYFGAQLVVSYYMARPWLSGRRLVS